MRKPETGLTHFCYSLFKDIITQTFKKVKVQFGFLIKKDGITTEIITLSRRICMLRMMICTCGDEIHAKA